MNNRQRRRLRDGRDQRLMLRAIDESLGNYNQARAIYAGFIRARANGRRLRPGEIPDRREFQRLDERFHDQERFEVQGAAHRRAGRPRVNWRVEERVIALARSYPVMGLRRIASRVGVSHETVRRIIRDEGLRPYRVQLVQALQPTDFRARRNFCRWMLRKIAQNPSFIERVLFSDESSFSSTSILNRQNIRIWASRNPHAMQQRVLQGRFAINVWAGIVGDHFVGPYFLPPRLNSQSYLTFLRSELTPHMRQIIPRHQRNRIYFMHDGAPPHFGRQVRAYLDDMFGSRWIGRRPAPHIWPPRSPDLNPLDFYLWGALKAKVYRSGRAIRSAEHLREKIRSAFEEIARDHDVLAKVRNNLKARLQACLRNGGRHVEAGDQARMLRAIGANGSILWVPSRQYRRNRQL